MKKTVKRTVAAVLLLCVALVCACFAACDAFGGGHKHVFGGYTDYVSPTCTEDGVMEHYTCSECGKYFLDENLTMEIDNVIIPCAGHSNEYVCFNDSTCFRSGNVEHWHCLACEKNFSDEEGTIEIDNVIIEPDHEYGEWIDEVPKTCTSDGVKGHYRCQYCEEYFDEYKNEIYDLTIEADHEYGEWIEEVSKTCTTDGVKEHYTCSDCGKYFDKYKNEIYDLTIEADHEYGDWIEEVSKTCTTDGVKEHYTCLDCGKSFDEDKNEVTDLTIEAGHEYDWVQEVPKTCTTDGVKEHYTCLDCGKYFDADKNEITDITIKAGHEYGEWIEEVPKTCTKNGRKGHYECSYCYWDFDADKNKITDLTIQAGHEYGEWVEEVPKTCTTDGVKGHYTCSDCGEYFDEDNNEITDLTIKASHFFVDGNDCSVCSQPYFSEGLEFTLLSDGTYSVSKGDFNGTELIIPAIYNCKAITVIADFSECDLLTSVTMTNSITAIESSAFSSCSSLTNITLSDSVTSIGYRLFWKCSSLANIIIPNSVTSIGASAFWQCSSLTRIVIPDSVTSIGKSAFGECNSLESITLPFIGATKDGTENTQLVYIFDGEYRITASLKTVIISRTSGVTSIGKEAFHRGFSLTDIVIPDSVTSMGKSAFDECDSLESITLPFVNNDFDSLFGTSDVPTSLKTVEITGGNGGGVINSGAFAYCSSIENIIIGSNVTSIGEYAFSGCSSLTSITIPSSVTSIGASAFYNMTSLASITVDDNNEYYKSDKGICLYTKDGKTLVIYAAIANSASQYTVPDDVTRIESGAFYGCINLTSVTLPFIGKTKDTKDTDAYGSHFGTIFDRDGSLREVVISGKGGTTSIGEKAFYSCKYLTRIVIGEGITSIGEKAFYDCSALVNISIPSTITNIGDTAFYGCSALSYNNSNSVNYLGNTSNPYVVLVKAVSRELTSYTINENCKLICYDAFYQCTLVGDITIPDGVIQIGDTAFYGCSSLSSVNIPDSVTYIGDMAFNYCEELCNDNNKLDGAYYLGNSNNRYLLLLKTASEDITSFDIKENCKLIHNSAFSGCSNLETVNIPNTVTRIGDTAFSRCSSLSSVSIPDSVTYIGDSAFYGCGLTTVTIPQNLKVLGCAVFADCASLKEVKYNATECSYIDMYASWPRGVLYGSGSEEGIKVIIGKNVKKIPSGIFYEAANITEVEFEEGSVCSSLGGGAFQGCKLLTTITIPNSVTSIRGNVFCKCDKLENIIFDGTVAQFNLIDISSFAFQGLDIDVVKCTDGNADISSYK